MQCLRRKSPCLFDALLSLQEYAGIDAERLERMEARLKADVLAEAGACSTLHFIHLVSMLICAAWLCAAVTSQCLNCVLVQLVLM